MPSVVQKARDLFLHAVGKLPPSQWQEYVTEACAGDAELERQVWRLLNVHLEAGSFLEKPAVGVDSTLALRLMAERKQASVQPREAPGTVIGRYQLAQLLGQGGFGTVWMARQTEPFERLVALKVIKAGMDSEQVLARFEAERQALALMDHPNIAHVLDAGTTTNANGSGPAGQPYFVMELVGEVKRAKDDCGAAKLQEAVILCPGVPITRYCDEHRLTLKQRLELFLPVCQAVQHAHQKGIIHRDLKPGNVLVGVYDGVPVPKVIDFGVAKAVSQPLTDRTLVTGVGSVVGTLESMSPEQAEPNQLDIDTRSDVYSLGVLLYELVTGTTPLDRKRVKEAPLLEVLRLIREEEPPLPSRRLGMTQELSAIAANRGSEPRRLSRLVRGELDWIVMKCLDKDRNRRYESAAALALDLQRYLNDEPVLACPPSLGYRLSKFARRHKGGVLLMLALVVGIIGSTWGMICATSATAIARQSERDARDQLFLALWNQARAGRLSRQVGQRLDSLDALAKAAHIRTDDRLRDEAIAAMALPDLRRVPVRYTIPVGTIAVSHGGEYRLYARTDAQGKITIRSVADDKEVRRIESDAPLVETGVFLSADERFLIGRGKGHRVRVWRVADGQLVLADDLRGFRAFAFSPDGKVLAVGCPDGILCFDLETGKEIRHWGLPALVGKLAFHPDSRKLAVTYNNSNVVSVYDAANGALVAELPVDMRYEPVVAWHPDGERLAVAGSDPRIQVWNVAARRKVATLEGHVKWVTGLTFHPAGGLLASHSWDGILRLWDPATGRPLLQLPVPLADSPRFSSDGRWLAAATRGEQVELLEVTPNPEYRTLVSGEGAGNGSYNLADISPDGRLLTVGMNEGARLWDLRSGRELAALPAGTLIASFESTASSTPSSRSWNLLTGGPAGLQRWPVASNEAGGKNLRLGPPRQLSPMPRACFGRALDGHSLAAVSEEGGANRIVDLESGGVRCELGSHSAGDVRALSPDGRWAASSGWHSERVRLWDAHTGKMVHEWVVGKRAIVFFTPDSRALIISRDEAYTFYDVTTRQPGLRIARNVALFPGHVAFSRDGKLMALEMAPGVMHLMRTATDQTVAKLEGPHGDRSEWHGFTPDGTQLVVVSGHAHAVHVWDLRAIRERLSTMGLDWDWPAFGPAGAEDPAAGPPAVTVVASEQAATAAAEGPARQFARLEGVKHAIAMFRGEVAANPDSAMACNNLAWTYLTAPEPLRDVPAAVALAEKAVRLAPENAMYCGTLGAAYCRAGRDREVVAVLRPNLERQVDRDLAVDLYCLAVSYHRLGETARARDYYDWATRWARTQRVLSAEHVEQLAALRAEVDAILGIKRAK